MMDEWTNTTHRQSQAVFKEQFVYFNVSWFIVTGALSISKNNDAPSQLFLGKTVLDGYFGIGL
jgi:hypothetical protein